MTVGFVVTVDVMPTILSFVVLVQFVAFSETGKRNEIKNKKNKYKSKLKETILNI